VASSTVERTLVASSQEALEAIAAAVAKNLAAGDRIALLGDLGAGKTAFVRGLARGLGHPDPREVVSPTFAIHNRYEGGRLPLDHVDLYRLPAPVSFAREGLEPVLDDQGGVLAVEWAERLAGPLPGLVLTVRLTPVDPGTRSVTLLATALRVLEGVG
jgi:tRNA threonylcarbamoyladenosine biosynthesis protein TsaE